MRHKKTGRLRLVQPSQKTTPRKSRRLTPDERRQRKLLGTERRVRAKLREDLRNTVQTERTVGMQKEDELTEHTWQALKTIGVFYRTAQGPALFFRHLDHKLYELDARPEGAFGNLITHLTDMSVRVPLMTRCIDRLRARVGQEAKAVEVHSLAYNSRDAAVIAMNDLGGGMWHRKRGGKWRWKPNGSHGILFWTPPDLVEPWSPTFSKHASIRDEDHVEWLLQQGHFADDILTVSDQQRFYRVWLISLGFPSRNIGRPVIAHLGLGQDQQYDTGKTTFGKMIGIVLAGSKFEPQPLDSSEKGKEALHLSLEHYPYVLLDNVDTRVSWLNDVLCVYVTGGRLSRRMLYADSKLVHHDPRGRLGITSRMAKFTREDTASRIIPLRFRPISVAERKPEWELLNSVIDRRGRIWAGLLTAIARVQDALPTLIAPNATSRLADFEQFGWCVAKVHGEEQEWVAAMAHLKEAQAGFALEDEPLTRILREILKTGDVPEQPTSQFYGTISHTAEVSWADVPGNAAACTNRLRQLKVLMEAHLDVEITMRTLHGQTLIQITRGSSWGTPGVTGVTSFSGKKDIGGE